MDNTFDNVKVNLIEEINHSNNFNFDDIRHYFTIESVTNGIFEIYQNLLGFKFIDITSDYKESIYHEDVKLFAVYDKNNLKQVIGYFYQ